jgi:hypothetical protein
MQLGDDHKRPQSVPERAVKVLGGTFHVSAILCSVRQTLEDVLSILDSTPADRWFVMVADHNDESHDALAMIDDALEFQIFAHGVLRQD